MARELLADFREVEHNFRQLDRRVRERIALWEGSKGALLEQIMGERDAIADSDQGRSFRAFWDFLLSSRRQEELSDLLDQVLALPAVADAVGDQVEVLVDGKRVGLGSGASIALATQDAACDGLKNLGRLPGTL